MTFRERHRVRPGRKVDLAEIDPRGTPGVKDETRGRTALASDVVQLDELQYRLYAEGRRSLLIVLQGMDCSGKDGVVRKVMSGFDPLSCRTHAFKVPSSEEAAHDFLWRVHRVVPGRGEIAIFNRSHYEAVLVERVKGLVPKEVWSARYDAINVFEHLLVQGGTAVLKFYLHISRKEQRKRLLERLDDPIKRWKFNPGDIDERGRWKDYRRAYEDALRRCSTRHAPWFVIPADRPWYRNHAIARIVLETLREMDPKFPEPVLNLAALRRRLIGPAKP